MAAENVMEIRLVDSSPPAGRADGSPPPTSPASRGKMPATPAHGGSPTGAGSPWSKLWSGLVDASGGALGRIAGITSKLREALAKPPAAKVTSDALPVVSASSTSSPSMPRLPTAVNTGSTPTHQLPIGINTGSMPNLPKIGSGGIPKAPPVPSLAGGAGEAVAGLRMLAGVAGKLVVPLAAITAAAKAWDMYVEYRAKQIGLEANVAQASLASNGRRKLAEMERDAGSWKGYIPFRNTAIGVDEADREKEKKFLENTGLFRERSAKLGQYNPELAMANARGEIGQIKRDIGQASINGSKFAEVEMAQQQLDETRQMVDILKNQETAQKQLTDISKALKEEMKILNECTKDMSEEQKAEFRRRMKGEDALDKLERLGGFNMPNEGKRIAAERANAAKANALNIPVLDGFR